MCQTGVEREILRNLLNYFYSELRLKKVGEIIQLGPSIRHLCAGSPELWILTRSNTLGKSCAAEHRIDSESNTNMNPTETSSSEQNPPMAIMPVNSLVETLRELDIHIEVQSFIEKVNSQSSKHISVALFCASETPPGRAWWLSKNSSSVCIWCAYPASL